LGIAPPAPDDLALLVEVVALVIDVSEHEEDASVVVVAVASLL
jgi:hypothetical protein